MKRIRTSLVVALAVCGVAMAGGPSFTVKPAVSKTGNNYTIAFSVSQTTDVEVAIVGGASNKVVRHLAAGLLGTNAPLPFKKGSLAQEIVWDGSDDVGKPVSGPCQARVSIGARPVLDQIVGRIDTDLNGVIVGVAVGTNGEVILTTSTAHRGGTDVRVLDKDGKYLRTIIPYPPTTPGGRSSRNGGNKNGRPCRARETGCRYDADELRSSPYAANESTA